MKNYIVFVNDHSGSMVKLAHAAITDYNANIVAVKEAASREMLDTVVSVVGVGIGSNGYGVERQVQISNPHVLRPVTHWSTNGGTPLYDGIGSAIELIKGLPDAGKEDVSCLVMVTTDGEEQHSKHYSANSLRSLIEQQTRTGRWTFVFRVPRGARLDKIQGLGVPLDNIQQWDTTTAGMAASTAQTTKAMDGYFTLRSSGLKASSAFYADAAKVNVAALEDISKKVSLYVVPPEDNGIEIRPFILRHRMEYLKGSAFYQLTKTESRVTHTKQILVRDRPTGKIFAGKEARSMIGLPSDRNARLHPGDHKNYDIFIQSESVNRKLVGGTGVVYWKEIGVPFTETDLAYLQPKPPAVPAVVQLPAVPVKMTPTPSPIPVTPRMQFFAKRGEARAAAVAAGKVWKDAGKQAPKGKRWYVQAAA